MGSDEHRKLVADFGLGHAYRRIGMLKEAREMLAAAYHTAKARYDEDPENKDRIEWLGWGHKYFADLLVDEGNAEDAALARYKQARPLLVKAGIEKWWPEGLKEIDDKIKSLEKASHDDSSSG
jgi:hypothetical protein